MMKTHVQRVVRVVRGPSVNYLRSWHAASDTQTHCGHNTFVPSRDSFSLAATFSPNSIFASLSAPSAHITLEQLMQTHSGSITSLPAFSSWYLSKSSSDPPAWLASAVSSWNDPSGCFSSSCDIASSIPASTQHARGRGTATPANTRALGYMTRKAHAHAQRTRPQRSRERSRNPRTEAPVPQSARTQS